MKKGVAMAMALLMVFFYMQVLAEPAMVPDNLLHDAILTLSWPDEGGEFWAEGHVVLDTERSGDTVEVDAQIECQNYGFMDGVFTDTGGGLGEPIVITFQQVGDGYELVGIQQPEDGDDNGRSIEKMLSAKALSHMKRNSEKNDAEIKRQMTAQAQAYLVSIGRKEPVQDWRDRDLQLSDILTEASNLTISFAPPYPLWITNTERLENGVRYSYTRVWAPDGTQSSSDGETGTETLTKTRHDDQKVIETITIRAELNQLRVTYQDDGGTKTFQFSYDGSTYHQPKVTQTGAVGVSYPSFEQSFEDLPQ